jgi:hypothetical protein
MWCAPQLSRGRICRRIGYAERAIEVAGASFVDRRVAIDRRGEFGDGGMVYPPHFRGLSYRIRIAIKALINKSHVFRSLSLAFGTNRALIMGRNVGQRWRRTHDAG